jgi:hypothetical protein
MSGPSQQRSPGGQIHHRRVAQPLNRFESVSESTIPLWLSLIAISSLLQVTMVVVAVIVMARNARKMQLLATEIRQQITPVVLRANLALDDVQGVVSRVRTYDRDIRRVVSRAGDHVHQASHLVRVGSSPFVGIVRGATAALSILLNGKHDSRATGAGGTGHAR